MIEVHLFVSAALSLSYFFSFFLLFSPSLLFFIPLLFPFFFSYSFDFYFPASGQAVITGVVTSPPPVLAFNSYRA